MKIAGSIPDFTGGLERALFARKTSPLHYAAATRIKDVVQFSILWSSLIRPLYVRLAQKQPEAACFLGFFVFTAVCIRLLSPEKPVG